jgi:ligand-binding sensor domain-containing protein
MWVFLFLRQRISFLAITIFLIGNAPFIFSRTLKDNSSINEFRIVHWDSKDGLTLGYKNTMIKDINGFLWIGSPAGLNRFDGNTFKAYFPGKNEAGTIIGSYCFSMVEDSLHNIWIGTKLIRVTS